MTMSYRYIVISNSNNAMFDFHFPPLSPISQLMVIMNILLSKIVGVVVVH